MLGLLTRYYSFISGAHKRTDPTVYLPPPPRGAGTCCTRSRAALRLQARRSSEVPRRTRNPNTINAVMTRLALHLQPPRDVNVLGRDMAWLPTVAIFWKRVLVATCAAREGQRVRTTRLEPVTLPLSQRKRFRHGRSLTSSHFRPAALGHPDRPQLSRCRRHSYVVRRSSTTTSKSPRQLPSHVNNILRTIISGYVGTLAPRLDHCLASCRDASK